MAVSAEYPADETNTTVMLRPDSFYVRTDDGVWLGSNAGSFTIKGAQSYRFVDSVAAALDGSTPLSDLLETVPDHLRVQAENLVEVFLARGFAVALDQPLHIYREQYGESAEWLIHYLSAMTSDPVSIVRRLLSTRIFLIGNPAGIEVLSAVIDQASISALVRGHLPIVQEGSTVLITDDSGWPAIATSEYVPKQAGVTQLAEHYLDYCAEGDVVLIAAEGLQANSIGAMENSLKDRGASVGVIGSLRGRSWALLPERDKGLSWTYLVETQAAFRQKSEVPTLEVPAASMRLAALGVVQGWLHQLADEDEQTPVGTVLLVEGSVPAMRQHQLFTVRGPRTPPAPSFLSLRSEDKRPSAEAVRPVLVSRGGGEEIAATNDVIIDSIAKWTDSLVGPLTAVGEEDFDQIPLGRTKVSFLSPTTDGLRLDSVLLAAPSTREARNQAVLNAIEIMARSLQTSSTHDRSHALGAGWTLSEAKYRALLRDGLTCPIGIEESRSTTLAEAIKRDDGLSRELVDYLVESTLSGRNPGDISVMVARLQSGLTYVSFVDDGLGNVVGVGFSASDAAAMAMMRPSASTGAISHLVSSAVNWADVWDAIPEPEVTDVSASLPFVDKDAFVVELTAADPAQ